MRRVPLTSLVVTCGTSAVTGNNLFAEDFKVAADLPALLDIVRARLRVGLPPLGSTSAELAVLGPLREEGLLRRDATVHLVHTDASRALAAVAVIRSVAEALGHRVKTHQVPDLNPRDRVALRSGLDGLLNTLDQALSEGDPAATGLCTVGGYKAMVSWATQLASLRNLSTFYSYENTEVVQELLPLPLQPDQARVARVAPLVRAGDRGWEELSAEEQAVVEAEPWAFERVDGLVGPSRLARLLQRDPRVALQFALPVRLSEAADKVAQGREDFVARELAGLLASSAEAARHLDLLQHESAFARAQLGPGWHLYKGNSKPLPFRAVYRLSPAGLEISTLWLDHDLYERQVGSNLDLLRPTFFGGVDWTQRVMEAKGA